MDRIRFPTDYAEVGNTARRVVLWAMWYAPVFLVVIVIVFFTIAYA